MAADAGIRAAYERYLADEAIVFRPLPVRARDWLATHEPATGRLEWVPVMAETACDSSFAVTLGTWSYTAHDSATADSGHYMTVWGLADGVWRIVLDHTLNLPALPARADSPPERCSETGPTRDKLLLADRDLNDGLRNLHEGAAASIAVRAVTVGSVTGSDRADLAVTHGELVDRKAARGEPPAVRAVYVRVWQRSGRSWRVVHDFQTPVTAANAQ